MRRISYLILMFIGVVIFSVIYSCSKNPLDHDANDKVVSADLQAAGKAGVAVFNLVQSSDDASTRMRGRKSLPSTSLAQAGNTTQTVLAIARPMYRHLPPDGYNILKKSNGRTIIWEMRWRDETEGKTYHARLEYDDTNGHAYAYQVITDFAGGDVVYDSTAAEFDVNFTLSDSTDDRLLVYDQLQRYRDDYHLLSTKVHAEFDDYPPGTEPHDGVAESESVYAPGSDIERIWQRFETHAADTGMLIKRTTYENGDTSEEQVNFFADGTGTFVEKLRDGTHAEGTFDTIENDNQGSYTKNITYPAGHDPVSVHESWSGTFHPADSTMDVTFNKTSYFADGHSEIEKYEIDEFFSAGIRGKIIKAQNSDGTAGEITIWEYDDRDEVQGWWTEKDEKYIRVQGKFYDDGSARVEVEVYVSKEVYEKGGEPIMTGSFYFNPDGNGSGQVLAENESHDVKISSSGSQTVVN